MNRIIYVNKGNYKIDRFQNNEITLEYGESYTFDDGFITLNLAKIEIEIFGDYGFVYNQECFSLKIYNDNDQIILTNPFVLARSTGSSLYPYTKLGAYNVTVKSVVSEDITLTINKDKCLKY